jgi:hypothetical protein
MGTFYRGQTMPILKNENIILDFPDFLCLLKNAPRMERLFE